MSRIPETSARARFRDRVEPHGINEIPVEDRHSRPRHIFAILIGANLTFGLIVLGWLPVLFGLSWWASLSSILVGAAVGAVIVAPMAMIGPRTGTNGPVSSGAFFGVVGRIIGSLIALLIALGFYALAVWTGGQVAVFGAHKLFGLPTGDVTLSIAYAVIALIAIAAAVYGYHYLLKIEKILIPTAGTVLLVGLLVYAKHFDAGYEGGELALGSFWPTWMLAVTIAAGAGFGWAPYVNDWTRYVDKDRWSDRSLLLSTGFGAFVGVSFPLGFGAYTAVAINDLSVPYVDGLVGITPVAYLVPLMAVGIFGSLGQSTVCIYSNGLDFSSIFPVFKRVPATLILSGIGLVFIYLGTLVWDAEHTVVAFVAIFSVLAAPWISITVTGHLRRSGYYDPWALQVFNRGERGGIYWFTGGINLRSCVAWLVGSVVGLLMLHSDLYTGPWSGWANGVDLSWLSALVLGAGLYLILEAIFPEPSAVMSPDPDVDDSRHARTSNLNAPEIALED
jgi:purine-cytosine permease-like protein